MVKHLFIHITFSLELLIEESEKYGLKVWLCPFHHNMSSQGVHFDKELDIRLKRVAQKKFEEHYPNVDFVQLFGRNYLEN